MDRLVKRRHLGFSHKSMLPYPVDPFGRTCRLSSRWARLIWRQRAAVDSEFGLTNIFLPPAAGIGAPRSASGRSKGDVVPIVYPGRCGFVQNRPFVNHYGRTHCWSVGRDPCLIST